jgi:hypothetical protein
MLFCVADEWLLTCLRSVVPSSLCLDYLALKKAILASETSVPVCQSLQRNIHEGLALLRGIAKTTSKITIVTVLLGSLCDVREVSSEEMGSGLLWETSHAGFLKRICSI